MLTSARIVIRWKGFNWTMRGDENNVIIVFVIFIIWFSCRLDQFNIRQRRTEIRVTYIILNNLFPKLIILVVLKKKIYLCGGLVGPAASKLSNRSDDSSVGISRISVLGGGGGGTSSGLASFTLFGGGPLGGGLSLL